MNYLPCEVSPHLYGIPEIMFSLARDYLEIYLIKIVDMEVKYSENIISAWHESSQLKIYLP